MTGGRSSRRGLDWPRMEAEYVTGNKGVRQIARDYGTAASTVSRFSRENGWQEKRDSYRNSLTSKAMDLMADAGAVDLAKRNLRALGMIERGLESFERQIDNMNAEIAEGKSPWRPRDIIMFLQLEREITMQDVSRSEERHLGVNFHLLGNLDSSALKLLEASVRPDHTDGRTESGDLSGVAEGSVGD